MGILPCDCLITTDKYHVCCSCTHKHPMTRQWVEQYRTGKATEEVPQELRESQVNQYYKIVHSHKGNSLALLS